MAKVMLARFISNGRCLFKAVMIYYEVCKEKTQEVKGVNRSRCVCRWVCGV